MPLNNMPLNMPLNNRIDFKNGPHQKNKQTNKHMESYPMFMDWKN